MLEIRYFLYFIPMKLILKCVPNNIHLFIERPKRKKKKKINSWVKAELWTIHTVQLYFKLNTFYFLYFYYYSYYYY